MAGFKYATGEWEVISFAYSFLDQHYIVKVARFAGHHNADAIECIVRTVYMPTQPRIGQLIVCPKLI